MKNPLHSAIPLLGAALIGCIFAQPALAEGGWKQVRDKGGTTVSTRHVPFSEIDEIRAATTFDFPPDLILAVLIDVEHYPANMPPTTTSRRIRGSGDDRYYYMEIKPSVAVRRYYCMRQVVRRGPTDTVRVEWSIANDLCPNKQGGMVRIEDNAGAWTLTPIADGRTQLLYQAHTDPGGAIPASLVNWVTPGAVHDLIESLRRATARAQLSARRN